MIPDVPHRRPPLQSWWSTTAEQITRSNWQMPWREAYRRVGPRWNCSKWMKPTPRRTQMFQQCMAWSSVLPCTLPTPLPLHFIGWRKVCLLDGTIEPFKTCQLPSSRREEEYIKERRVHWVLCHAVYSTLVFKSLPQMSNTMVSLVPTGPVRLRAPLPIFKTQHHSMPGSSMPRKHLGWNSRNGWIKNGREDVSDKDIRGASMEDGSNHNTWGIRDYAHK